MKKQNFLKKIGDFALGKGFYIVLFLCVAAIGISGYYLYQSFSNPGARLTAPAGGNAAVTLPDSQARDPAPIITAPADPVIRDLPEPQPARPTAEPPAPEPAAQPGPAAEPAPQKPAAVVYTWPVNGEVLRDFSLETLALDPTLQDWRTHGGLDIAAAEGTKVIAMRAGTVSEVRREGMMGETVKVDHGDGLTSVYQNLGEDVPVREGSTVETGTVIGTVGNTAIAESNESPHIHLETWLNGKQVDPLDYLPKR